MEPPKRQTKPAIRLSKRTVDAIAPSPKGQRVTYWDDRIRGFGVRVSDKGAKVYIFQYRSGGRGTSPRRVTIGRHGEPWTPDQARKRAEQLKRDVAEGRDPQAEKVEARTPPESETVEAVVAEFIARDQKPKNRSWREAERILNRELKPLADRHIRTITKRDIIKTIDAIVDRGSPYQANRCLAYVRRLFNWCLERDIVDVTPVRGIKRPAPEPSRDRVLTDDELVEVWRAAEAVGWPIGPVVHLLILTGQRRTEVGMSTWSEFDLPEIDGEDAWWTIPADRSKNARMHALPLSKGARRILEDLPRMETERSAPDWVFTLNNRTPFDNYGHAKARLDTKIHAARVWAGKAAGIDSDDVQPMPPWRLHDLRRTVATGLARLKVISEVRERILNHVRAGESVIAAVYQRYDFGEEMRAALDRWDEFVASLVEPRRRRQDGSES